MIKVDNSFKKRVFYYTTHQNEEGFKKIKEQLFKIIEDEEYAELKTLIGQNYTDQFSVFIFYNAIQEKINKILNPIIKKQLLKLDWFTVLVGGIQDIRKIIEDNYCILSKIYPLLKDFEEYKKTFENLYKNQLSNNDKLKREFFSMFTNMNVCPYCNRNFINPIYKEESLKGEFEKWSPDIEHFFPKSIYPFLSLSISNLLPSCAFCNKIKHGIDTYNHNCISPYEVKEGDFEFDFNLESTNVKEVILKTKGYYNSKLFHIESLYNEVHKEYINDILNKPIKYPDIYKDKLNEKGQLTENDYIEVFRNYYKEDDFNKHPLSKMTKELMIKISEYSKKSQ